MFYFTIEGNYWIYYNGVKGEVPLKRTLLLFLSTIFLLALVACAEEEVSDSPEDNDAIEETEVEEDNETEEADAEDQEPEKDEKEDVEKDKEEKEEILSRDEEIGRVVENIVKE